MKAKTSVGKLGALAGVTVAAMTLAFAAPVAAAPTIVKLTQTGCQFVESENGVDHGYKTASIKDCERINAKTGKDRLAKAKVLRLKPGAYVFRVTNKNVPYMLGFWLRDHDYEKAGWVRKAFKTSVSGGGMHTGKTIDYRVTLKPGKYVYSCPLNPTPNYVIMVE